MKQLSIFDVLQELDAAQSTTQAELQNQSNLSARITASTNESKKVEILTAKDEEDCALLKQWREIKAQYPDALLLFRVGDFYEAYNEDAEQATKILGITLCKRGKAHFDFCGFPFHALDTYLPKLVRAGHRVAICDQLEDVKKATKNLVKRGTTELSKF